MHHLTNMDVRSDKISLMLNHVRDLMAHQEWADARFFYSWKQAPATLEDEKLRKLADHMTMVQGLFLKILKGEEIQFPDPMAPPLDYVSLVERARSNHKGLKALVAGLKEEDLSRPVHPPWFPDSSFQITVADALEQVAMHTQHHRAQNLARLSSLGGKTVIVDWIVWLYKGREQASWESIAKV